MSKFAIDVAMKKRMSKGGVVANEGSDDGLDDLVQDDHLESTNTGASDGDDLGEPAEVKNEDMVDRIMRKRKGK